MVATYCMLCAKRITIFIGKTLRLARVTLIHNSPKCKLGEITSGVELWWIKLILIFLGLWVVMSWYQVKLGIRGLSWYQGIMWYLRRIWLDVKILHLILILRFSPARVTKFSFCYEYYEYEHYADYTHYTVDQVCYRFHRRNSCDIII